MLNPDYVQVLIGRLPTVTLDEMECITQKYILYKNKCNI